MFSKAHKQWDERTIDEVTQIYPAKMFEDIECFLVSMIPWYKNKPPYKWQMGTVANGV